MIKLAACLLILAAALALGAVGGWTLHTGTHPSGHALMDACVNGQTFGIDTHTYVCRQINR